MVSTLSGLTLAAFMFAQEDPWWRRGGHHRRRRSPCSCSRVNRVQHKELVETVL